MLTASFIYSVADVVVIDAVDGIVAVGVVYVCIRVVIVLSNILLLL